MKKILITFFIISLSAGFSFAEDGVINSIIENKNSAFRDFKNFFKTERSEENSKDNATNSIVVLEILSDIKKEVKIETCENKIKVLNKKEKINLQLKSQIKDKNKLIDKLLEISADSATSTKEIFDNKILKLETEVGEAIKIQKNILNLIASSTENNNICDTTLVVPFSPTSSSASFSATSSLGINENKAKKEKVTTLRESKEYSNLNKAIKKLELENDKQLEKINKFIKTDIKNILVEINSVEEN